VLAGLEVAAVDRTGLGRVLGWQHRQHCDVYSVVRGPGGNDDDETALARALVCTARGPGAAAPRGARERRSPRSRIVLGVVVASAAEVLIEQPREDGETDAPGRRQNHVEHLIEPARLAVRAALNATGQLDVELRKRVSGALTN
jgi:hypothetical protein